MSSIVSCPPGFTRKGTIPQSVDPLTKLREQLSQQNAKENEEGKGRGNAILRAMGVPRPGESSFTVERVTRSDNLSAFPHAKKLSSQRVS